MSEATEREEERQGKSAAAIAALDAGEQGTPKKKKKKKKPIIKPVKKSVGTGDPNVVSGLRAREKSANARLKAAIASNSDMAPSLREKLNSIQADLKKATGN